LKSDAYLCNTAGALEPDSQHHAFFLPYLANASQRALREALSASLLKKGVVTMKQFFGKYRGIVTDNRDPDRRGRIRASVPVVLGEKASDWSLPCVPFAGKAGPHSSGVGFFALPPVGAEVWIEFEGGDPAYPIWTGCLWGGYEAPPEAFAPPAGGRVLVKTEGGSITIFGAASESGGISLETAGGQKIELRDGPGSVDILDSNGNSIRLETGGITVTAAAKVTINASTVELSAGSITVNAGMSRFSGVVQADTVICNSVISASYSPGAGNIW
jgi:uncharacterized protein involved in type VI secretion and phage assembly